MSELDDKLREIMLAADVRRDKRRSDTNETIAQIKQAFADAETNAYLNRRGTRDELMTGQEWYDRFEKELPSFEVPMTYEPSAMLAMCMQAAKRAAGLET